MTAYSAATGPWLKQNQLLTNRLIALFNQDLSFGQITEVLKEEQHCDISRSAVIAKARRLKLTRPKRVNAPRLPRKTCERKVVPHPKSQAEREPPLTELITKDNLLLVELRANHCRYPLGETRPFRFCCRPKLDGSEYCARHHLLVHSQPRSS